MYPINMVISWGFIWLVVIEDGDFMDVLGIYMGMMVKRRGFHSHGGIQDGWLIMENHIKVDDLGVPVF